MFNNIKVGLSQNTLGPNVYGGLFEDKINQHVTAYVDYQMLAAPRHNVAYKIAILIEPIVVISHVYRWVEENHDSFDLVMTHNKALAEKYEKFKYYPIWPRIWIPSSKRKIYKKTKMVSAIFSKQNSTEGHRFRHIIADKFSKNIDLYGRAYKEIECKTEGLAEYRYQVVVENEKLGYASEKVNDCFCCGTIPIYWGGEKSNINDYYSSNGIIMFKDLKQLENILYNIVSEADYESRQQHVKENFSLACDLDLELVYWSYGIKDFMLKVANSEF